jgi:hypothetical protein
MGKTKDVGISYTMTEYNVDPLSWYSDRQLSFTPKHFTVANTVLTQESKIWILNVLKGRFSIVSKEDEIDQLYILSFDGCPAFEDPAEAVAYELYWS